MNNKKARAIGINHVSLQVGNIRQAIDFYTKIFDVNVGAVSDYEGSLDLGDQFIAFTKGEIKTEKPNHFGFVVDNKSKILEFLIELKIDILPGKFLGFLDPWGNHIEIINYDNIRFSKTDKILESMSLCDLNKNERALQDLELLYVRTRNI
jgi:lactoylglutathione lyase